MTINSINPLSAATAIALAIALATAAGSAMATEEPRYAVSFKDGSFEVRDYPAMVAAEVNVAGERAQASSAGFKLLAGYIFGGNTTKQRIAMTAPVTQTAGEGEKIAMTVPVLQTGQPGSWTVRFVMPSRYTLDTLPTPNDDRVHLQMLAPARLAVVQFSGLAREDDIAAQTDLLTAFIARRNLAALGQPALARYNPPWTPWFMRRNEVMVPVREQER